jgi:ABC-type sugar transport system permease subunit
VKKQSNYFPYLLVAPSALVIILVLLVPLGYSVYCSLYKCNYMKFTEFVGLANYAKVFANREYMAAFGRTFSISAVSLALSLGLGVFFALWINQYRGAMAYSIQLLVLIPWVTSQVVGTLLWKWIFSEELGLLNHFLRSMGADGVKLLSDPTTARFLLIFVISWRTIGYAMVNILAGLKSIPESVEEAAVVDGVSKAQMVRYVRLPMVKTQILISSIILTLSNINNLTVPLSLTGGGPGSATNVITIPIYRLGFESYQFGLSSAMSILLFLMTMLLSIAYVRAAKYEI